MVTVLVFDGPRLFIPQFGGELASLVAHVFFRPVASSGSTVIDTVIVVVTVVFASSKVDGGFQREQLCGADATGADRADEVENYFSSCRSSSVAAHEWLQSAIPMHIKRSWNPRMIVVCEKDDGMRRRALSIEHTFTTTGYASLLAERRDANEEKHEHHQVGGHH